MLANHRLDQRAGDRRRCEVGLVTEVVEVPAGIAAIRPAWRQLARSAGPAAPFLGPEWIESWWQAFGPGRALVVIPVWQQARLVGIAALMLSTERRYGVPVRRLGALANVHSPRFDLLVDPAVDGVIEAIWDQIAAWRHRWDIFELPAVPASSATLARLLALAEGSGLQSGLWTAENSPFITTRIDWNVYLSGRSRNLRKELRRKHKRLSALGEVGLEIVTEPAALMAALPVAFEIEADSWKGQQGTAMRSTAEVHRFYHVVCARMAARGHARLHFLRLDGERIAFDLSLFFDDRLYSLKSGFRAAFAAVSPGLNLLSLMLQHYIAAGLVEIDLLGDEDDFKKRWTDTSRAHAWFVCVGNSARGRLVGAIKFGLLPRLRRARNAARRLRAGAAGSGPP